MMVCGLCADARGDRFPLVLPLANLAFAFDQLGVPIAKLGVQLDVSSQLFLNQVDEEVDFLLAVTTLAEGCPGERNIVYVCWSERHWSSPGAHRRRLPDLNVKGAAA